MQIAIIADTHMPKGNRRLPDACIERLKRSDAIVHAGDFTRARCSGGSSPTAACSPSTGMSTTPRCGGAPAASDGIAGVAYASASSTIPDPIGPPGATAPMVSGRSRGDLRSFPHSAARARPRRVSDLQSGQSDGAPARPAAHDGQGVHPWGGRHVRAHRARLTDWPGDGLLDLLRRHGRLDPDGAAGTCPRCWSVAAVTASCSTVARARSASWCSSVGLADVNEIFLTHFHTDHWLGLPGMLKTFDLGAGSGRSPSMGRPGCARCSCSRCGRSAGSGTSSSWSSSPPVTCCLATATRSRRCRSRIAAGRRSGT